MKRIVSVSIALLLLVSYLPMVVNAINSPVAVYVNGEKKTTQSPPVVAEKQAYIQAEDLAAIIGAIVSWNNNKTQVTLKTDLVELKVTAENAKATINGNSLHMGSKPILLNNSIMVPLQSLAQPLGFKVIWDALTQSVYIYMKGSPITKHLIEDRTEEQSQVLAPAEGEITVPEKEVFVRIDQDRVTIVSNKQTSLKHFYLNDNLPYRIVIDYPASAFGYEGQEDKTAYVGEVLSTSSVWISKVRFALHDLNTLRFVIELKRHADYSLSQLQQNTIVDVKASVKTFKVVIDAGHGGKDPGATGTSKRYEKLFSLELSKKIYDLMAKDAQLKPYMTRTDDTFVELEQRAAFANDMDADLLISIHGNTYDKQAISGTETYYYSNESLVFGQVMHKHIVGAAKLPDRGLRKASFKVLKLSKMPAVLLELGYLSTASDEKQLLDPAFQDRVAAAVVAASREYLIK
jgi:N-acetylmuramoyl-L-alanine amidase